MRHMAPEVSKHLLQYLHRLTIHDFLSIKAHLSALDHTEKGGDQLHNYYSALAWLDQVLLSWISTSCPSANGCTLADFVSSTIPSNGRHALVASHLRELPTNYETWARAGSQTANPLDQIRPGTKSMLDLTMTCWSIRDALSASTLSTSG